MAAVCLVGSLGVGLTASAAHADETKPVPGPIDHSSIAGSQVDRHMGHPLQYQPKATKKAAPEGKQSPQALTAGRAVPGDVDGDRISDIVEIGLNGRTFLSTSKNNSHELGLGAIDTALLPGDIDNNGEGDLIVRTVTGELRWYTGSQISGTPVSYVVIGTGWNIYNRITSAGDLSGDGHPDLVAREPGGDLYLYKGLGNGRFGDRIKIGNGWGIYDQVTVAGDLTGDGESDLLARLPDGTLYRYDGNGSGGFKDRVQIGFGWQAYNQIVAGGDWNGDGAFEVLARTYSGGMYKYSSLGNGQFGDRVWMVDNTNYTAVFANMGGAVQRGKGAVFGVESNNTLFYYGANNKGGFEDRSSVTTDWTFPLFHLNSLGTDYTSDLLTVDGNNSLYTLENGGHVLEPNWGGNTATFSPGDLNRDGYNDLVTRQGNGDLYLYRAYGDSVLSSQPIFLGQGWNIYNAVIGAGDMTGDGIGDVVARTSGGDLYVYPGLGNNYLGDRIKIGNGWGIYDRLVAPGDMDGDGLADIIARDSSGKLFSYGAKQYGGLKDRVQIGNGWGVYKAIA
ncbi:FG-GAP repeat domain-containing protein [Embleya sp. NPDC020886]|uniref:FG-GAP repeat domain-containing protein n=1 Tax=Embleya sp. NPDC020886 TaxID=3363980 RepID=UPI0037A6E91E